MMGGDQIGLAYCDVAFTDKRTFEVLRKAGVKRLPRRNSEFTCWFETLS